MTHVLLASQLPVLIVLLGWGRWPRSSAVRSGAEIGTLGQLARRCWCPTASDGRRCSSARSVSCDRGRAAGDRLPVLQVGPVAFFAMSTYVLLELRRRRPDAGCGCFGEVSAAPVGLRSIGRTMVLTGMAVGLSLWAEGPGWQVFMQPSWFMAAGVVVLLATVARD